MVYLKLFLSFLKIGLFSIGGGYAALPIIEEEVINANHWLTLTELTDVITISEMTPGPIAINAATFIGTRVGGILGSAVATFGFVLPSFVIVLTLSFFYYRYKKLTVVESILKGLRPTVVALIAGAGVTIIIPTLWSNGVPSFDMNEFNFISIFIFGTSIVCLKRFKPNPIIIILGSGVVGGIIYML